METLLGIDLVIAAGIAIAAAGIALGLLIIRRVSRWIDRPDSQAALPPPSSG